VLEFVEEGGWRAFAKKPGFPADSVWPWRDSQSSGLIYLEAPGKDEQRLSPAEDLKYPVYRYVFEFPEIHESFMQMGEMDAAALRPEDPSRLPKLEAVLLADYLKDSSTVWSLVDEWKLDANNCFFKTEDKERAGKNVDFTPKEALALLGKSPHPREKKSREVIQQR
jgi:hypothetical protein